jgi:vanillate O-demethylase ferredoxin subunit
VLREPASRGGSAWLHDHLKEGDGLQISLPRNHFELNTAAGHHLLIAGGIGITPLLCMAQALHDDKNAFSLHYCSRTPERAAFVESIKQDKFAAVAEFYFDSDSQKGPLPIEMLVQKASDDTHLYVCRPGGFIDSVLGAAQKAGWDSSRCHREYFAAVENTQPTCEDKPFKVKIASTGRIFDVAVGETIVDVLAREGVNLLTSCNQGVCGSCITGIVDGKPDHRDYFLSDRERAQGHEFTPCCSRSLTPMLVLDL